MMYYHFDPLSLLIMNHMASCHDMKLKYSEKQVSLRLLELI